jgi:hypothetical protein
MTERMTDERLEQFERIADGAEWPAALLWEELLAEVRRLRAVEATSRGGSASRAALTVLRELLTSLPMCNEPYCKRTATRGTLSHEPHFCEEHRNSGYSFHECDWADAVHDAERLLEPSGACELERDRIAQLERELEEMTSERDAHRNAADADENDAKNYRSFLAAGGTLAIVRDAIARMLSDEHCDVAVDRLYHDGFSRVLAVQRWRNALSAVATKALGPGAVSVKAEPDDD